VRIPDYPEQAEDQRFDQAGEALSMIRKSVKRFSEKVMLK
jgi:hypothetical protein